jgi:hypothetical protein
MNKEAGKVMDEIVDAIAPLCNECVGMDELRAAVRKTVKLAVETWRYARLEREKIEAVMPSVDDDLAVEETESFWASWDLGDNNDASFKQPMDQLLLRVFPIFKREPVQECFWVTEKDGSDRGCVYSHGWALYTV